MSCHFQETLHYTTPAHGGWGMVRIGMLIPESVQLFVCPFACGRHGALGAMKQGLKSRLFYLYVDQKDVIAGYDDLIPPAVDEVLDALPRRPRVFLIFVSCLDDLIGTDHQALLDELADRHPDVRFRFCHMNPISLDGATPPPVSIRLAMYSLLDEAESRDQGLNTLGNLAAIDESSELHAVARRMDGQVRHISRCSTFDEFQTMAKSRLNLVLAPPARKAASALERRLKIASFFCPPRYDLQGIEMTYEAMFEALGGSGPDYQDLLTTAREKAASAVDRALDVLGHRPISLDESSVVGPFGLARALIEYGFRVERIVAQKCLPFESESYQWFNRPGRSVEVVQPQHHERVFGCVPMPDGLAIGLDAAYLGQTNRVVDIFQDQGAFGYGGVTMLMNRMLESVERPVDLRRLIADSGRVI